MNTIFDYYHILGLDRLSGDEDVREAHRHASRRYHPDRETGDQEKFVAVQEAYAALKTKSLRRQHLIRMQGLGTKCEACDGKGYKLKAKSFTSATTTLCTECKCVGYIPRRGREQ